MYVVHVHTHVSMYVCTHGDQRLALGVFLNCLSHCVLKQSLPLDLDLTDSARVASQTALGVCRLCLPKLGLQTDV